VPFYIENIICLFYQMTYLINVLQGGEDAGDWPLVASPFDWTVWLALLLAFLVNPIFDFLV
jgi:hypothetical protein